jgi:LysM repeat protein
MKTARILVPGLLAALLPLAFISSAFGDQKHVVSPGDTLSALAQVYVVTVGEIVEANGIENPNLIIVGQELIIPGGGGEEPEQPAAPAEPYRVQAGDTLSGIANRFGMATAELASANRLADPSYLRVGQKLTIPARGGPAQAPSAGAATEAAAGPAIPPRPDDPETEALLDEFAAAYGVDPSLVKAVATVESAWRQDAVSSAGAVGVMQLMPSTIAYLEEIVFKQDLNENTEYDNVKMGVKLLQVLLEMNGGNERNAVAAYYQGLTPAEAGVYYPSTQGYIAAVFAVRLLYWP